ncbi:ribonuclease H-like domain-containing protein [Tanacetum coccineum]
MRIGIIYLDDRLLHGGKSYENGCNLAKNKTTVECCVVMLLQTAEEKGSKKSKNSCWKDIEKRFGGNASTKKISKGSLNARQYENSLLQGTEVQVGATTGYKSWTFAREWQSSKKSRQTKNKERGRAIYATHGFASSNSDSGGYRTGEITISELRKKLEKLQKEKDSIQFNVDKFENASESLNKLIECHIVDNCKKDEFVNKPVVENRKSDEEVSEIVRKNNDAPIIEEWVSDSEEENEDASKQGRINAIDADDDITLVSVQDDADKEMFDVDALNGEEVFVADKEVNNEVSVVEEVAQVNVCGSFDHLQFSIARTPQQNGVAERRNRTLVEAAGTMLADSKLPTTFWAEAVNTACYVQNRVLVVKPHNKTPYKIFHGITPTLSFVRPFGCPVTILNTIDHLGKFDGKADEDPKSSHDDGSKPSSNDEKKVDEYLRKESECNDQEKEDNVNSTNNVNAASTNKVNVVGEKTSIELLLDPNMPTLEDYSIFDFYCDDEDAGAMDDMNNLDTTIQEEPKKVIHSLKDPRWIEAMQEEHDSMGKLQFFRDSQVQQKKDGIFISLDKYVVEILKKFVFIEVKTASIPMETQKPLLKDENDEEVDVSIDVLKGQPKLGLWYPKYSPFDLVAYTDSDYAGASLDRKSISGDLWKYEKGGKKISGKVTDLFPTMLVQNQMGEGSAMPTDPQYTPTVIQPSPPPQKTQKPKKPKRKDTQVPQSSVPIDNVANEVVHKELGASILEAEQDSGNITKTRSKATPNEAGSQGTTLGGGPRRQETMGDTIA